MTTAKPHVLVLPPLLEAIDAWRVDASPVAVGRLGASLMSVAEALTTA